MVHSSVRRITPCGKNTGTQKSAQYNCPRSKTGAPSRAWTLRALGTAGKAPAAAGAFPAFRAALFAGGSGQTIRKASSSDSSSHPFGRTLSRASQ